jgi:hypothetical protein
VCQQSTKEKKLPYLRRSEMNDLNHQRQVVATSVDEAAGPGDVSPVEEKVREREDDCTRKDGEAGNRSGTSADAPSHHYR